MDGQTAGDDLLSAIRPEIAQLPESGILIVANYGREKEGLLPLWFGEGDLPTPDFIGEAATTALKAGNTFYTYQRGIPPLRQALSDYLERLYSVPVATDRLTVTTSGMQAIMLTMQMLVGPGDEMVAVSPVWPNIFSAARITGGTVRQVATERREDGWRLDLDRLVDACGPKTRAIFINSPSNPTGWIMPEEDMIALRDFARGRGIWIIADEVYGRFVYDGPEGSRAPSFLEITEPDDRLIVINTFSKNWSMTGWRIGWVVAPPALGRVYENLVQFNTSGTTTFLQHGAATALNDGDPTVDALVERCRKGREIVCSRLETLPNIRLTRPAGAFYLLFGVEGETDSIALAKSLIDRAGVGLAPGSAFGEGGEGYLRLCFAGSHAHLEKAMDRLVPALGG
ncbi:pyridoxal phosphate-dependent aminotransferase [Inquilinus sp. CAU 1745]|uniref:pyridoxal phosphate-dependent aminotransferase n=1 Tax=Inquilinus sp. CAU 1745 TaxID=3140369 RepID=UPI00325BE0FF